MGSSLSTKNPGRQSPSSDDEQDVTLPPLTQGEKLKLMTSRRVSTSRSLRRDLPKRRW